MINITYNPKNMRTNYTSSTATFTRDIRALPARSPGGSPPYLTDSRSTRENPCLFSIRHRCKHKKGRGELSLPAEPGVAPTQRCQGMGHKPCFFHAPMTVLVSLSFRPASSDSMKNTQRNRDWGRSSMRPALGPEGWQTLGQSRDPIKQYRYGSGR